MDKLELMRQLKTWYGHPPGQQLAAFESYYVNRALHEVFGCHLLHFGDLGSAEWLEGNAVRYPVCLSESGKGLPGMTTLQTTYADLPIQESSIDIVVLPHILEFEQDPKKILEEVERVLVPHGYVIILGFNPASLWGIYRTFGWEHDMPPWQGHSHSIFQMRHFLNEKNFDLVDVKTFFFRPPIHNSRYLSKLRFLEILGQFIWAYGGGAYLLVAQKKVMGATPLRLSWWERWTKSGLPLPEPVARYK